MSDRWCRVRLLAAEVCVFEEFRAALEFAGASSEGDFAVDEDEGFVGDFEG